jgi:hypothetical protein
MIQFQWSFAVKRIGTSRRAGNTQQWIVACILIAFTIGLVVWIISNRPDAPRFDQLRINTTKTPPPQPRGSRLVLEVEGRRRTRPLDSPSFSLKPGEQLLPEIPPGPFAITMIVPIRIAEPLEAAIVVEFADCDVEIIHNTTLLGEGESALGASRIQTERLPFPIGTFDFHVNITSTGDAPRCSVSWITDESAGPVPIPAIR